MRLLSSSLCVLVAALVLAPAARAADDPPRLAQVADRPDVFVYGDPYRIHEWGWWQPAGMAWRTTEITPQAGADPVADVGVLAYQEVPERPRAFTWTLAAKDLCNVVEFMSPSCRVRWPADVKPLTGPRAVARGPQYLGEARARWVAKRRLAEVCARSGDAEVAQLNVGFQNFRSVWYCSDLEDWAASAVSGRPPRTGNLHGDDYADLAQVTLRPDRTYRVPVTYRPSRETTPARTDCVYDPADPDEVQDGPWVCTDVGPSRQQDGSLTVVVRPTATGITSISFRY